MKGPTLAAMGLAQVFAAPANPAEVAPLVATYSIVARDPETGALGVAVQSHWPAVGALVCWARPGVGAVATQAWVRPAYGPEVLGALAQGKTPEEAFQLSASRDPGVEGRQVGVVDAQGRVFAHTGSRTIREASHLLGSGFSVQANMMANETVVPAMREAYQEAKGPFPERLLAALEGAQAAGGDVRGKQSAAILVVASAANQAPTPGGLLDLRVDDHTHPLEELARLLRLRRAYDLGSAAQVSVGRGDLEAAEVSLKEAARLAPDAGEPRFWVAVTMLRSGHLEAARRHFRALTQQDPAWAETLRRLPGTGSLPAPPEGDRLVEQVLAETVTNGPDR